MLRRLSATPCPTTKDHSSHNKRDSIFSAGGDTTADLDFTTSFKASFRDVKPKRRPTTFQNARRGPGLDFAIHEDEELKVCGQEEGGQDESNIRRPARRVSIAQPPIRPTRHISFVQNEPSKKDDDNIGQPHKVHFSKPPRRASINPHYGSHNLSLDDTLPVMPSPKISRPPRRGTIYIPTDDTTMPSMYMGLFSPVKDEVLVPGTYHHGREQHETTGIAAQMAMKKNSRKSMLANSPKRGPLNTTLRPLQATGILEDRIGQGSGKENLPPGHIVNAPERYAEKRKARRSVMGNGTNTEHEVIDRVRVQPPSRLFAPTASSSARERSDVASKTSQSKSGWNAGARKPVEARNAASEGRIAPKMSYMVEDQKMATTKPRPPTRFVVPVLHTDPIEQTFPILPEGIPNASMYDDSWLSQQEVALTQLVNNLFIAARPQAHSLNDNQLLRLQLGRLYGVDNVMLIYRRIQGALLFGTLSIPYDGLARGKRLYNDLGARKTFTDLWLTTYDPTLLQAALEVVVGRLVLVPESRSFNGCPQASEEPRRCRAMRVFLETFLLRSEDKLDDGTDSTGSHPFQCTILRSLMLVKLLDLAGEDGTIHKPANLFQTTSQHKNSESMLITLMQMLNPSAGQPTRALAYLGYVLSHSQYALKEYDYAIGNLAVDIRDGVCLTRLVELLLYRSASRHVGHGYDSDAMTTLCMPTGEVLSLLEGEADWPLSQHLKFPCISRATKLFNVQIALSALQAVKEMEVLIQNISAEHIVDGFREKTVKLIWGLTSKWGLGGLVDWSDVKSEIGRLRRIQHHPTDLYFDELDLDDDEPSYLQYKALLKAWARVVAGCHRVTIHNFNTSFSDGTAFASIIDEYQPYLGIGGASPQHNQPLAERLTTLGCSNEFSQLFAVSSCSLHKHHIFDNNFVLASLAFLCSRLLGPTKKARAAVVIQRAWRRRWNAVLELRKVVLCGLANACAKLVQARHREDNAQRGIRAAWLRYKASSKTRGEALGFDRPDGYRVQEDEDIWLSL